MRFVVTPIIALILMVGPSSGQASAVAGYDSDYAGESAFLNIAPGPSQPFQVFFKNTGTTTWQKNTASQVNLAICRADKTTCNVFSPNAEWNDGTWLSSIAYATTSQDVVMPGELGTFRLPDKGAVDGSVRHVPLQRRPRTSSDSSVNPSPGLLPGSYRRGTVADGSAQRTAALAAANASTEPSRGCMTPIMLPSESLNHAALRSPASKTPSTVFIVG